MSGPSIKNLSPEDRPRERLERYGAENLSNLELLAILLRVGTAKLSVLHLAEMLLARFNNLTTLSRASITELSEIRGMGLSKAVQLLAAFELGRRLQIAEASDFPAVSSPQEVAKMIIPRLRFLEQEHFLSIHLNTKNKVLAIETITMGTLDSSLAHPREVFKSAIRRSCAAIILAHNHPSGDPRPSKEDLNLTRRLKEAGDLLGISVLDHIIIGDGKYTSLKEEGLM